MKLSKKILKWTAVSLLWLVIWQLLSLKINQQILLPSPLETLNSLIDSFQKMEFWYSVLYSILRIIIGYSLAIIVGIIGGVLSSRFSIFNAIISPILHLIRAVPVASFIILAFFWFKSDELPIFISFLMVLPMIWSSVENGISLVDKKYLELAKIYKLKPFKVLFEIKIPFILPSFLSTAMTALGFAWKSGIAAEVICLPKSSLGGLLQKSKLYIDIPNVFALTATVAILSLLLEMIVRYVIRRFTGVKA